MLFRAHELDDRDEQLGFAVLIRAWFRDYARQAVYPILLSGACRQRGLFAPKALEPALRRHAAGRVDLSSQIFRWLSLELRCRDALDSP